MTKWAYYNEIEPFAAAWIRELMKDGLIAPGEVDERSIEDVTPDDIRSFRQCHFFAGIGIWSLAAREAGWSDDTPFWSGSCPCQPFSQAGKGEGFDDERHLWPAFHYLIEQCGPALVTGEQVAGTDGDTWLDLVSSDLDATGYAFGAAETSAAGFGAPHIRSRNYWVADGLSARLERYAGHGDGWRQSGWFGQVPPRPAPPRGIPHWLGHAVDESGSAVGGIRDGSRSEPARRGNAGGLDHAQRIGRSSGRDGDGGHDGLEPRPIGEVPAYGLADAEHYDGRTDQSQRGPDRGAVDGGMRGAGRMADDAIAGRRGRPAWSDIPNGGGEAEFGRLRPAGGIGHNSRRPGPVNGYWSDADWLRCRDDRWRPVESGTFPLANAGAFRNRVGLLRGAGNAVTLGQAVAFLKAVEASLR